MGRLAPAEYVCRVGNYNKLRDVLSTCERPRRRVSRLQHNLTTHSDRPWLEGKSECARTIVLQYITLLKWPFACFFLDNANWEGSVANLGINELALLMS